MKKFLFYALCSFISLSGFAQIVKQGEKFESISLFEGKVTFIKEIPSKSNLSVEDNYKILKSWAGTNFGKDPFASSIRYGYKEHEFVAKSRIELLLPANTKGVREKMIMRYSINGFLIQNKCVLEISEISYLYENSGKGNLLSRVIRAEDFITDEAIVVNDSFQELKVNTRKSTLFFLNELTLDFENQFGSVL